MPPAPASSHNPVWDLVIVIAFVVFLWFAWIAMGGPAQFRAKEEGLFVDPLSSSSTQEAPTSSPTDTPYQNNFWASAPSGTTEKSPYTSLVSLRINGQGTSAGTEYVEIAVSPSAQEALSITGWTLSSSSAQHIALGTGSVTLSQGTQPGTDIVALAPGTRAFIVTGRSPVGTSFRTNVCSGYLGEHQPFVPSLAQHCPSATATAIAAGTTLDTSCMRGLSAIAQCTTQGALSSSTSPACSAFIREYVSYNGCVRVYKNSPNFSDGTWYIYLNQSTPLWPKSGTLTLKDTSGRIIQELTY